MLGCSLALADIQIAQGRLGDAARTFESGLRWTAEHPGLRGAADMHVGLSEVLIERNDLDAAARHLQVSDELGEHAGLPQNPYRWRVATARLRAAAGRPRRAHSSCSTRRHRSTTPTSPRPCDRSPPSGRGCIWRRATSPPRSRWAADRGLGADDDLSYVREYEHVTLARMLLAQHAVEHDAGSLEKAITLLHRLLAAAEEGHRAGSAIEVLTLLATAHRARGDVAAATAALEDAVRRAEPEGYVRVFLDAGPAVAALLRDIGEHRTARATGAGRHRTRRRPLQRWHPG